MPTPFGPQLIGETEKTLGALLRRFLEGTGLTESHWVTLRLAERLDGSVDADGLATAMVDRAHLANAAELIGELTRRGLIDEGRPTPLARELIATVQTKITTAIQCKDPKESAALAAQFKGFVAASQQK